MARDLDFNRASRKPPTIIAEPVLPNKVLVKKNQSNWLVWTILIFLFIAVIIGVWQFLALLQPTPASIKTPSPTNPDSTNQAKDKSQSLLSPQSTAPLVQVYDSGAGQVAVDSLVEKLGTLGYKMEYLEKSQFNYDRTYIRYREGMQAEAEKIKSALPERLVSLSEVKSAGLFDILILYGTK